MKNESLKLTIILLFFLQLIFAQKSDIIKRLSYKIRFLNSKSIDLEKDSYPILDSISNIILKDSLNYSVESHSAMMRNALEKTKKRSELIKKELIKRGIDQSRLSSFGYGMYNRRFICTTRACDTKNERIEIKVLE